MRTASMLSSGDAARAGLDSDRDPDSPTRREMAQAGQSTAVIASPTGSSAVGVAAPRRVPFLDLSIQDKSERDAILAAIETVLCHGRLILGPEVQDLERRIAASCGRRYGIGVGSGTDALILGLKALGIGGGDEVITTPLSWLATARCHSRPWRHPGLRATSTKR